jgi:hypothetical protein
MSSLRRNLAIQGSGRGALASVNSPDGGTQAVVPKLATVVAAREELFSSERIAGITGT